MRTFLGFAAGCLLTLVIFKITTPTPGNDFRPDREISLDEVYPFTEVNDAIYSFSPGTAFESFPGPSGLTSPERALTISYRTNLATFHPGDVELICMKTQAYDPDSLQLGAEIYFTREAQQKFKETQVAGKGKLLRLQFDGQRMLHFFTDDASIENYAETSTYEVSKDDSPLGRYSDLSLTVQGNNEFALMALIQHLSPASAPVGCSAEDTPEQIDWWQKTTERLWGKTQ